LKIISAPPFLRKNDVGILNPQSEQDWNSKVLEMQINKFSQVNNSKHCFFKTCFLVILASMSKSFKWTILLGLTNTAWIRELLKGPPVMQLLKNFSTFYRK
jgi:hypothetical protein